MKAFLFSNKYNYPKKIEQAMKDGNIKYLKMLIKKGKIIPLDVEKDSIIYTHSCG